MQCVCVCKSVPAQLPATKYILSTLYYSSYITNISAAFKSQNSALYIFYVLNLNTTFTTPDTARNPGVSHLKSIFVFK